MLKGGISKGERKTLRVEGRFEGEDDTRVMKCCKILEGHLCARLTEGQQGLKQIRIISDKPGLELKLRIFACFIHHK